MTIANLADLLRVQGKERPNCLALTAGQRSWTYRQLDEISNQVAQGLLAIDVGAGDRVAFLDKNSPEYFPILFGAAKVNAVTVAVNWRLAPPEMEYIIDNAEARALFIGSEFLPHLQNMDLPHIRKVIVLGEERPSEEEPQAFTSWSAGFSPNDTSITPEPDDTCYQLYTSGTTGLPKGVELTNRNLFTRINAGPREWRYDSTSVSLLVMPLFHIAGCSLGVATLNFGGHTVLLREVDPVEILEAIPKHQITNCLLVPSALQQVLAVPDASSTDFSSLRAVIYGASPISEQVLTAAIALMGCDFVQAYGSTETTGAVTCLKAEDHDPGGPRANLLRSAGEPWGDVELKIVDPETLDERAEGEVGEVLVRSRQTMKGYWKDVEATEQAYLPDKWFRTGDAGYLKDGYLFLHDRVKDMIISGAENIYPAEIENVLMKHRDVSDVAVIGVPDDRWGEAVKALVVPAPDGSRSASQLISFCREQLAAYKCPKSVDFVETIPRNPSGKILKNELREPYWKGHKRHVH